MAMRSAQIPHGVKDFREIREKGLCCFDKTAYMRRGLRVCEEVAF